MTIDLVPLWTLILGVAVFFYVLLDGFDLGVGILYAFAPNRKARHLIMQSIAPVWDGNETWLILGSMGLLAAFPLAFAIIIPAVYFPILIMLLALIFRGVAFEFHFSESEHVTVWDRAFSVGSLLATFAQGVVLGAFIHGFKVHGRVFVGSSWDCFTPFSLFTGAALVFGYALLGAGWLILKTEGEIQAAARRQGRFCLIAVLIAIVIISAWTPFVDVGVRARWFTWPNFLYFSPIPLLTIVTALFEWRALEKSRDITPFIGAIVLFLLAYLGIVVSLFPFIVPYHFTLWQAASSLNTQLFLAIGTLFLLPIVLMYTAWSYWVFRGKVRSDISYH